MSDRRTSTKEDRRGSTKELPEAGNSPKQSNSPYARIRRSFVAKFGFDNKSSSEENGNDKKSIRRKTGAPKVLLPEADPEDIKEMKQLIVEGQNPETRRSALLGLFKLSLYESLLELLISEGAVPVFLDGLKNESKGSGARRAAMGALKNLAAHEGNHDILIETIAEDTAKLIEEEAPGSGPRQAALETLANLCAQPKNRTKLGLVPNLLHTIMNAAKNEPQGTAGREAALIMIERLSEIDQSSPSSPPPPVRSHTKHVSSRSLHAARQSADTAAAQQNSPTSKNALIKQSSGNDLIEEEGDEEELSVDVQGIIDACVETASKEPKGSSARAVAVRTLRNYMRNHAAKIAATPNIYDHLLVAAKEEGAGSEARALVFSLFSDLAAFPQNRPALMKTNQLVEIVISSVRDEPPGSPAREHAMFTVAQLALEPKNRTILMKDNLVGVCVRACTQEAPGSGGRAAALEVCASLALAEENQIAIFNSPGLVALAVESAAFEKSDEVRLAGLDVMVNLARASDSNRNAIFKMKHASEAVIKAANDFPEPSNIRGAGIAAVRSFCLSPEIANVLRKSIFDSVMESAKISEISSRSRTEAICALEEGLFDKWNVSKATFDLINVCAEILKNDVPASETKTRAVSLISTACKHKLISTVIQAGIDKTAVTFVRNFVEVENVNKTKNDLYSRASLRRAPVSKHQTGSPEQLAADCKLGLNLLATFARQGTVPEGTLGVCLNLIQHSKENGVTHENFNEDLLNLTTYIATKSIFFNCGPNSAVAKDMANKLVQESVTRFLPMLPPKVSGSVDFIDALDSLFTLSSFSSCVGSEEFKALVPILVDLIIENSDKGDQPKIQLLLTGIFFNCIFNEDLGKLVLKADNRPQLETALTHISNRGTEDAPFCYAGRRAQGVNFGLKLIGLPHSALPLQTGKEKKVSILCASDGLLLGKHVEEFVKKLKGFVPKVEEAEFLHAAETGGYEKLALKSRRNHLDSVLTNLKVASAVIICASKGCENDPVIRLLANFAFNSSIPTVIVTGIETTSNVCWGDWLDGFRTKTKSMEIPQLSTWTALGGKE